MTTPQDSSNLLLEHAPNNEAQDRVHTAHSVSHPFPVVYLARHGETAWTVTGQHTGLTDLPLTERGEQNARALGERLIGLSFAEVFTSPLRRAARTYELSGFGAVAETDKDLLEWDYGQYEGRLTAEIHAERPDWQLFRDGCPGGESPDQITARAEALLARLRALDGPVACFSHSHILCALAARWIGLTAREGGRFRLDTAGIGILDVEHGKADEPSIAGWNLSD